MSGMLGNIDPKKYPKRAEDLWGEKEAEQSPEQMYAALLSLVGSDKEE